MPKVLQINVTANWGSTGKIAEQIGICAMNRGWDSYIAYSRMSNGSRSATIKIGNWFVVWLHYFEALLFDGAGLGAYFATRRFIRKVKSIKPDIVHLHNIHGYVINYKLLFNYLINNNIPVIWTFHDFWAITGHCCHFIPINCEKWKKHCENCPIYNVYPKSFIDRSSANFQYKKDLFNKSNLHIVAVSKWVGEITSQSFLGKKPIQVIENGIDLNVFKPTGLIGNNHIPKDKFMVLGVATKLRASKGLYDYIELSKSLASDIVIVLVGVAKQMIGSLPKNIIGIERTHDQNELAALYSRADVLTSLSRAETFGLTIIESLACGTPAIVFDNTAPPSLINDNTGCVVPTGNLDAVLQAIQMMKMTNFKSLHRLDCINYAHRYFNKEDLFNKYIDLYENVVNHS